METSSFGAGFNYGGAAASEGNQFNAEIAKNAETLACLRLA
jgi:hypothetical protein